jgi:hypothetical protein
MQGSLHKQGNYELFETTKGHQILNLNDDEFYAVVEGQKGDILVKSDADHEKQKTVKKGKFYLAAFEDDPEFNDIPHLFLQEGRNKFREWILPRETPSSKDYQKKLVRTGNTVSKEKVEYHVHGKGDKGTEKQYSGTKKQAKSKKEAAGATGRQKLESKTKNELYEMAKRKKIDGRSKMDKDQLIDALSQ